MGSNRLYTGLQTTDCAVIAEHTELNIATEAVGSYDPQYELLIATHASPVSLLHHRLVAKFEELNGKPDSLTAPR